MSLSAQPRPSRRHRCAAAAAALLCLPGLATAAAAGSHPTDVGYSLRSAISPSAMTAAGCAADPRCVAAPAAVAADNAPALRNAIARAATMAVPAVVDTAGSVVTPARPATVFLASGNYRLGTGLQLPPNVNLRGSGITTTTLSMITADWANFSYGYLVRWQDTPSVAAPSPASTNLVADLTVNGNCREGAGAPTPADSPGRPGQLCDFRVGTTASTNVGGGIAVGDRWTVRQVRFTNLEYFKLWVSGVQDVHILDNRFDNWGGAESGDEDNIGGGGRNDRAVIEDNQFDKTIRGNSLDFTNAIRTTFRRNTVWTTPALAALRGVPSYGNLFLEGVQQATVADNVLYGGQIVLQSNGKYQHNGPNKDITNPRDCVIRHNRLIDPFGAGITVAYDDYTDADGSYGSLGIWTTRSTDPHDHVLRPGGGNLITGNTVIRPRPTGIAITGLLDRVKNKPDAATDNTVTDAGFDADTKKPTASSTAETSGISISIGNGDAIYGNSVVDDQSPPTTQDGIRLGARNANSTVSNTVLLGPAGETNTVTGVAGLPVRRVTKTTLARAGLTTGGDTPTWTGH